MIRCDVMCEDGGVENFKDGDDAREIDEDDECVV